jgi:hypothetical protein
MIINNSNAGDFGIPDIKYNAKLLFRNNHFNTIYPFLFRGGQNPKYNRERWDTEDGDFIDLDFIKKQSDSLLIILHGLEGSSNSQYVRGLINAMSNTSIDICAVNHRSCSGELNKTRGFYHSGFTKDLRYIISKFVSLYDKIYLSGYSLGGNMALKYAGEEGDNINPKIKAIAAVSVPCDLSSSAIELNAWYNRPYAIQFLQTLKKKAIAKATMFDNTLPYAIEYPKINTLLEYDNKVTAPLHGFTDAEDYYAQSSSLPYLSKIKTQSILINASDDSFLTKKCMPIDIANNNPYFHCLVTKYGGHVGFARWGSNEYWIDTIVKQWILSNK